MGNEVSDEAVTAADTLRVLMGRLRRRIMDVATDELPAPQASALARLFKTGPFTASTLAGAERVRPQSMATTLSALEKQGLIERTPDPDDGRRQVITLTEDGRQHAKGARETRDAWLAHALQDRYTDTERETINEALRLLDRLVQS